MYAPRGSCRELRAPCSKYFTFCHTFLDFAIWRALFRSSGGAGRGRVRAGLATNKPTKTLLNRLGYALYSYSILR